MALNSAAEAAEAESVVVTGSFDIYPVEYPALPPVEGTRINSGKKTSFVKPEEFPVFSNNDYREVTATTPGIIVSEEPNSPIINFGYRGLDSQRSEVHAGAERRRVDQKRAIRFSRNPLHANSRCSGAD